MFTMRISLNDLFELVTVGIAIGLVIGLAMVLS